MTPFLVFLGAGIGGVARYGVGRLLSTQSSAFPWNTLLVNVSGSLLITLFAAVATQKGLTPQVQAFLTIGICGGYTTFSSYSYETAVLIEEGQFGRAAAYSIASVVIALVAIFAGFMLARELIAFRERF